MFLYRCKKGVFLSGVLYFHRISDNRMVGRPLRNLRMFEELCGRNAIQNVILTTTMWDEVDEMTGCYRENELRSKYWKSMLERNSTTSRFLGTRESAVQSIQPLIDKANDRCSLLLQQEMAAMRTKLPPESNRFRLYQETERLIRKRQHVIEQIRNVPMHSHGSQSRLRALQEEYQSLMGQLDAKVNEMQSLKYALGKRLSRISVKWFPKSRSVVVVFII